MNLAKAKAIVHSLGKPSKMPGYAWGIPAERCVTGRHLRKIPGSVCYHCYAFKGRYTFNAAQRALHLRLKGLGHPEWVDAMVYLLGTKRVRQHGYFRWFDSGDLQSQAHLGKICEVVRRTPWLKHWMPTREYAFVRKYIEAGGVIPKNLTLRLSAALIDGAPPSHWKWTSGVRGKTGKKVRRECPSHQQNNKCGDCRACWDKRVPHISYRFH